MCDRCTKSVKVSLISVILLLKHLYRLLDTRDWIEWIPDQANVRAALGKCPGASARGGVAPRISRVPGD